ncbi:hypothetical protein [Candidatus Viadribacter manganicus]|nr:hypothetical protein [Candidatus Viadribacter manganicus]
MMRRRLASIGAGSVVFLAASIGATAFVAEVFDHQAPLGAPLVDIAGLRLYAPHKLISWSAHWSEVYPGPFAIAHLITLIGFVLACVIAALIGRERFSMKPFAEGAWGDFDDAKALE